jgi:hypothetical protein
MRKRYLGLIFLCAACAISASAQAARTVHQWEPFEVEMTARATFANAYMEALPEGGKPYVQVTFTGAGGMRYTVAGFWDGGQTWKARFAPPAPGQWSYSASSSDAGLNNVKGSLQCIAWTADEKAANPTRHGFVRVAKNGPRAGRYFEYADGTPFLWIGDTWWPWAAKNRPFARFQQVVDGRAEQGFTVGQLFFGANNSVMMLGRTYDTPDFDMIHNGEKMIAYANSKGITVWIHPWWSARNLPTLAGAEKMRRWSRYVVQRLAAYNVIWTVAGEYNMYDYSGMGLQFWKDMGALMHAEDPYGHVVGVHNTPPGWSGGDMGHSQQWSTGEVLHNEPWLDFNQSQTGHGKPANEMVPLVVASDYARTPAKPIVITETWYEFIVGSAAPEDVRFAAWSAFLSGAAGHTYGGGHQWWAYIPNPDKPGPPHLDAWPIDPTDADTIHYPGANSMGFMSKLLHGMEWWKLEPHPELVSDYAARYCSAIPGEEYLAYVRWGGKVKLDLRPSSPEDKFRFTWYDLVNQKEASHGEVSGGVIGAFSPPESYPTVIQYKDWLLRVTKVH